MQLEPGFAQPADTLHSSFEVGEKEVPCPQIYYCMCTSLLVVQMLCSAEESLITIFSNPILTLDSGS